MAWTFPASSLVDDAARLCVAAGIELCAVYPSQGSLDALAFHTSSSDLSALRGAHDYDHLSSVAATMGVTLARAAVYVSGQERAYVLFGSRNGEPQASLMRNAAAMIASAIKQAERLAHYHHVSDRLQRSLLPAHLPSIPGLHLDAAYSPGSTEAEVGGDWYDAFEMNDGRICISVGDVTGHGLESAVTMSELRRAIRAATFAHPSPQSALDAVDAIAASQNLGLATAIVGYLDPTQSVMEYASAGHPAPIFLTARGRAFPLLGGGTLLGLGIGCASPPRSVTLSPGTSLVLYTDGLIEYSRDIDAGEAKLIESIEALGARGMLVGRTLHDVVLEGDPRDDCATLIVGRLPAQESATERYSFTAVPASARLLRDAIRDFTGRCEIEGDREFAVLMAAGEAIANGIEHGSQEPGSTIAVEIAYDGATLSLEIESRGHWRSSASEHRGRGIGIMRSCAQRFQLSSSSERTRVSLAF